ncbi:MAG: SDR family NAD(P)-dependent oxidoreductase [Peptococcales bacterium]|jgi:3-oxoacyl-[acyl-carrier protein] reductase
MEMLKIERFLEGKTALITGASRGLGREYANVFSQAGADIIINYQNREEEAIKTKEIVEANGCKALIYKADVSDGSQVKNMVQEALATFGKIDILINNAGFSQPKFFMDVSEAEWDKMISVHLKGAYNCCHYVIPQMIERRQGKIINMSSLIGKSGGAWAGTHYGTVKAGLIGMTKSLAGQLAPYNINVNAVAPAFIITEISSWRTPEQLRAHTEMTALKRTGNTLEAAHATLYLASPYADYITGFTMDIGGGVYMD